MIKLTNFGAAGNTYSLCFTVSKDNEKHGYTYKTWDRERWLEIRKLAKNRPGLALNMAKSYCEITEAVCLDAPARIITSEQNNAKDGNNATT